ncbi:MAG: phosphopantothenoylcysteine decarboxylase [Planctomycetaceae bacterium]|jgi:phosphopantothenoylcysteine decarboxylase|nr:phosphopantothenoylcysteine decarboxylase [Planctomycetaceae bacterium]
MTHKKRIVVGISGGIAAYKSAMLVSQLVQSGHVVSVVMTQSATKFVSPATFSALTGTPAVIDPMDPKYPLGPHIELAQNCNLMIVAPATARVIASCALGLADDLLSTLYLNMECPIVFAPAMSAPMWEKPAVQRNVKQLHSDGVHLVGPESGWLSCRRIGFGRMSQPEAILQACKPWLE